MKSKFKLTDLPDCSKSCNALALNELIIIVLWRPFSLEIRRITCPMPSAAIKINDNLKFFLEEIASRMEFRNPLCVTF